MAVGTVRGNQVENSTFLTCKKTVLQVQALEKETDYVTIINLFLSHKEKQEKRWRGSSVFSFLLNESLSIWVETLNTI